MNTNLFKKIAISILTILVMSGSFMATVSAHAASSVGPNNIRIFLDEITVKQRGYTIDKPDGKMRMAIYPTVLPSEAMVTLKTAESQNLPSPAGLTRVSDIMEYDIVTDPIVIFQKDVVIVLSFNSTNQYTKRLYFWDDNLHTWRPLTSLSNYTDHWTRGYIHLPYARVAVFEEKTSIEGYASWYRSASHPYGAASNDFPMGSKVRVLNLDNGRSTTVEIVSTGPWAPGRVIDLTSDAFADLAPLSTGTAKVHLEAVNGGGEVLGETTSTGTDVPAVVGKSAIIWDPTENRTLYEKNSTEVRSIASITKLMTAIVVLESLEAKGKTLDTAGSMTFTADDMADCACLSVGVGDTMTVKDLLYASLTGSANNATKLLSRSAGLSKADFVKKMNARAKAIGLANASFVEPTGLEAGNKATAKDVAKLVRFALKFPSARAAAQAKSYTYTVQRAAGGSEKRTINNPTHIGSSILAIQDNFLGGKTGFTYEAGYCLGAIFRPANGREYIAVTLGSTSVANRNNDILQMMYWGYGR